MGAVNGSEAEVSSTLRHLADHGYATVPLLDRQTVNELTDLVEGLGIDPAEPYWATSVGADRATARRVDQELKERLLPLVTARLGPGLVPFLAAFIGKGAHSGRVGLHPDWTYTDERVHRAVVVWCPLVDTEEGNGAMVVVPGSHRRVRGLRGSGTFDSPVEGIEDRLWAGHVLTVPLAAGQAIVWDAALLHGSWPNDRPDPRPAAAIALAPAAADLVHFHRALGGPTEGFLIDESHYTTTPYGARPVGARPLAPWDEAIRPHRLVDLVSG